MFFQKVQEPAGPLYKVMAATPGLSYPWAKVCWAHYRNVVAWWCSSCAVTLSYAEGFEVAQPQRISKCHRYSLFLCRYCGAYYPAGDKKSLRCRHLADCTA